MLVETAELLCAGSAAQRAGIGLLQFQDLARRGQIQPMVTIDGLKFYHQAEVLKLRRFVEVMAGKRPTPPLPRTQDLF